MRRPVRRLAYLVAGVSISQYGENSSPNGARATTRSDAAWRKPAEEKWPLVSARNDFLSLLISDPRAAKNCKLQRPSPPAFFSSFSLAEHFLPLSLLIGALRLSGARGRPPARFVAVISWLHFLQASFFRFCRFELGRNVGMRTREFTSIDSGHLVRAASLRLCLVVSHPGRNHDSISYSGASALSPSFEGGLERLRLADAGRENE